MNDSKKREEKGLLQYSIRGGICNADNCLRICTVLCGIDDIWYCDIHAKEKVSKFISLIPEII